MDGREPHGLPPYENGGTDAGTQLPAPPTPPLPRTCRGCLIRGSGSSPRTASAAGSRLLFGLDQAAAWRRHDRGTTTVDAGGAKAALIVPGILIGLAAFIAMCGLNTVAPGEARVVQLFGRYRVDRDGLRWVNPFTSRTRISTRVHNHEAAVLKVNNAYGNPMSSPRSSSKSGPLLAATFEVDDFLEFVATPDRGGRAAHRDRVPLRCPRRGRSLAARQRRGDRREARRRTARSGGGGRGLDHRVALHASRVRSRDRLAMLQRRPGRWSRRGGRSWTGRSGWSRPRSPGSPSGTLWS